MNIFEKAARTGLHFATSKGLMNTYDVWALPLTSERGVSLESLAQGVYKTMQETAVPSFVNPDATPTNSEAQLKLDILKHIIAVRKEENATALNAREMAAKRQRIMAIMAERQDGKLATATDEELQKLLSETYK